MIDTHTHIFCEEFDLDRELVLRRAEEAGVQKMILPAIDSQTHDRLFEMCQSNNNCYAAIGLHPTSVNDSYMQELDIVQQYLHKYRSNIVAIGEVGIDLYWSSEFEKLQRDVFAYQIELAIKNSLPLIIHTRNAYDVTFDILTAYKSQGIRGVFHSFDQDIDIYKKMSNFGDFYFGVGGVVTFKKSTISKSIADIPTEKLLVETDAPYLSPVPFRGKRNEPSYLAHTIAKIAEIKDLSVESVADATHQNALNLFNII